MALFANEGGTYDDLAAYLRKRRLLWLPGGTAPRSAPWPRPAPGPAAAPVIEPRHGLARASAMLDVRRFDEAAQLLARVVAAEPEAAGPGA